MPSQPLDLRTQLNDYIDRTNAVQAAFERYAQALQAEVQARKLFEEAKILLSNQTDRKSTRLNSSH